MSNERIVKGLLRSADTSVVNLKSRPKYGILIGLILVLLVIVILPVDKTLVDKTSESNSTLYKVERNDYEGNRNPITKIQILDLPVTEFMVLPTYMEKIEFDNSLLRGSDKLRVINASYKDADVYIYGLAKIDCIAWETLSYDNPQRCLLRDSIIYAYSGGCSWSGCNRTPFVIPPDTKIALPNGKYLFSYNAYQLREKPMGANYKDNYEINITITPVDSGYSYTIKLPYHVIEIPSQLIPIYITIKEQLGLGYLLVFASLVVIILGILAIDRVRSITWGIQFGDLTAGVQMSGEKEFIPPRDVQEVRNTSKRIKGLEEVIEESKKTTRRYVEMEDTK